MSHNRILAGGFFRGVPVGGKRRNGLAAAFKAFYIE
jgi:hypothetical protein